MRPTPVTTPSAGRSPASAFASSASSTNESASSSSASRSRTNSLFCRASFSAFLGEVALRARARCARGCGRRRSRRVLPGARAGVQQRARELAADDVLRERRARRPTRRGRCPCRSPCRRACARDPRSPRCPTRPGAYGHPPSPPIDASKRVTPRSSAATTFASAVPRVLWKCRPTRSLVIPARSSASSRSSTRRGRGHTGGVTEREPVGARVDEEARDLRDPFRRDVALVRATERGRHDRLDQRRPRRDRSRPRRAPPPASRRPNASRSSGCASRSRSRRARSRRPRPRSRARRPSGSAPARSRRRRVAV